jgi:hypothetical protein
VQKEVTTPPVNTPTVTTPIETTPTIPVTPITKTEPVDLSKIQTVDDWKKQTSGSL